MAAVPCPACQKPMNELAVVCPHCNARRAGASTSLAGKGLSPAEIRALVLTDVQLHRAPPPGMLPALILPHPSTFGAARTAELALTVLSLPLVVIGALSLKLTVGRKQRERYDAARGELVPVIAMLGLGGLGLSSVLSLLGVGFAANLALTMISAVALIVRGVIRARTGRDRDRALHGMD